MNYWKWSKGEPYYKSARQDKKENVNSEYDYNYDSQKNAINQSLENNGFQDMFLNETRRELIDTKMADRELVSQRGVNPFLQTSYVNDIVTRDMFLKPINTTQGRTKKTNNSENNNTEQYTTEQHPIEQQYSMN